jgi:hypothetical protein
VLSGVFDPPPSVIAIPWPYLSAPFAITGEALLRSAPPRCSNAPVYGHRASRAVTTQWLTTRTAVQRQALVQGHCPVVLHSVASLLAFAVGEAKLVVSVSGAGPAVAVAPMVMAGWVGWLKVWTTPLPEPATASPAGPDTTLTTSTEETSALPPMTASSFVLVFSFI